MADPSTPVDVPLRRPCCLAGRPPCPLMMLVFKHARDFATMFRFPNITGFMRPTLNQSLLAFGPDRNGRYLHDTAWERGPRARIPGARA